MQKVFEYLDYKAYIRDFIQGLPKNGRGELKRIAAALAMHTTWVSQIFGGDRDLSIEQACLLCEYLDLSELETDCFLKLVLYSRAGTEKSRRLLRGQIERLKVEAQAVKNRLPEKTAPLSEEARAIFYSHWSYSAIRLLTSVAGFDRAEVIADRLQIPKKRVNHAIKFLVKQGLCIEKDGKLTMGPRQTHIEEEASLVTRHHVNWRLRALERFDEASAPELLFTAPATIARADIVRVRSILVGAIEKIAELVKHSGSEELVCLNIDWVKI